MKYSDPTFEPIGPGKQPPPTSIDWLPFAKLNLIRNPFGQLSLEERTNAAVVDVEPFVKQLAGSRQAIQFMGDCGRGKTTHLLALRKHLPDCRYVYLPDREKLPAIPFGQPLLIDEAQRLPWLVRRKVMRRDASLVLGTHADLSVVLRRVGYEVMTVQVSAGTGRQHIEEVFRRRIELARLDPDRSVPQISVKQCNQLISRYGTDIRAMESHLFEKFQAMAETQDG